MLTISAGEWEGIQHRPHHFMRRSAISGWTVVYIEPPATIISPFKNTKMINRWKNWLKGLREIEERIYLLAPPPTLPFGNKYRFINKVNQKLIARTIKKAIKKFNNSYEIDLFTFLPSAIDLLSHFKFNKIIYDCVDDHASFTGLIKAETVLQMEKELLGRASVSFATAERLLEDRKSWSNNMHLIPNGAEYEHFSKSIDTVDIPGEIKALKQPIIGFVGGIGDWIDINLMTTVAKDLPELDFVFIGPILTDINSLKELNNVKFFGSKEYKDLPKYIGQFSACIMPFKINKLTESVNPIKMFEYLSAGKPIISTPLKEVIKYSEYIEITSNEEEMVEAIEKILHNDENDESKILARQQVGRDNSWDSRWDEIISLINK